MFTQFAAFGSGFSGLREIDDLVGRYVDNAGLFVASDFEKVNNAGLLDAMMNEFPQWLAATAGSNWYK